MIQTIKLKRYPGEIISLFFSICLLLFFSFIVFEINIIIFGLIILFQLLYILISQRQFIGNALQVTEKQFIDIHGIVKDNAIRLGIKVPKVFIVQDPYLNAFTIGFLSPYTIVLTSLLVESLTKEEINFVLGHEMGHIRFGHSKILSFISPLGKGIPVISWLYGFWQRKAEFSSDRAGLFTVGEIKPAISTMLKMAVGKKLADLIEVEEIIKQIEASEDTLLSTTGESLLTHPYTMKRIKNLIEFNRFNY